MPTRPSEQDLQVLKWLLERLRDSEEYCEPYFDRAKRHYKLYRFGSAVDSDDWPYVNRTRSRDILAFCEDSTAIIIQTLFATMPFFSVIPRETRLLMMNYEQIDPMAIADQVARCLDYQISHEDTEFFEEIVDFFKGGMILGTSYLGVYPKFDPQGLYLRPLLKTTDFWDILPIAGARRITKARGVFVREFQSMEELKRLQEQGVYRNVEQIKAPASTSNDPQNNWHKTLLQEVGMTTYMNTEGDVEVIHYFSGGHVITFADRKVILRNSNEIIQQSPMPQTQVEGMASQYDERVIKPYPYDMPIVQYKYMPVPLEFFGMGIPEVLEILQEDKNLIRSARRDNIDLVINKVLKARSGADLNFDILKYYPGAIWTMENLQDIEPLEMQDVTQSSYQEETMRQQDMENALSLFGYARGMTPQHQEQPTTVMKLQQASLNRLDLAVKLAEFTTLQNIATRIILLTRRYMDQSTYEAIIGDQDAGFYRLNEEDIRRFYHFKPVGSTITHIKEIRQQQIQTAIQMLIGIPPQIAATNITPFTIDWYETAKTALDAIDIKNQDRILVKLQPPQQPMNHMGMQQGLGDPNEMQALANVMYGDGGALADIIKQSAAPKPEPKGVTKSA